MFDEGEFEVVVNDEGQYSIWPVGRPVPAGWTAIGHSGPKAGCLAHIDAVWTDMRPRSLREDA
uniref:MbtH family protein n=1 Tax=Herbidospora sakaeratensis TaxID=564415 RepID=UPI0007841B83|nr:MbtH family NRPS accessory protein [Herbidospora sakaeratensis]